MERVKQEENMSKALVFYKECYQYVTNLRSKVMDCDDGMVTESTLERWKKELVETEKRVIEILGFNKLG